MNKTLIAAAFLSAACSATAFAEAPNWNNVSVGYGMISIDDLDEIDPAGVVLAGTALVNENVFLLASWAKLSDDFKIYGETVDVDFTQYNIGAGYRYGLSDTTDAYATLSFVGLDFSAEALGQSESEDETGYGISAGIRSMLTPQFELGGSIDYVDIGEGSDTSITGTASYHFNKQFALGLSVSAADDSRTTILNAQYKW